MKIQSFVKGILLSIIFLQNVIAQTTCINTEISFANISYTEQGIRADYNAPNVIQRDNTLHLVLTQNTGGTRISFKEKIQYGSIEAKIQVSPGSNVVSSFILMADNGDEIDFEFVGKDPKLIQTNFFYRGIPIYDKNAKFYATQKDLTQTSNTYKIIWTEDYYEWLYNDFSLRKLFKNQTTTFPNSPSYIQFGIWQAQNSQWAGNGIDWSKSPFEFEIDYINISCNTQQSTNVTSNSSIPKSPVASNSSIPKSPVTNNSSIPKSPVANNSSIPKSPVANDTSTGYTSNGYRLEITYWALLMTLLITM